MSVMKRFGRSYQNCPMRDGAFGRRHYVIIYAISADEVNRIKFGKTSNMDKRFSALCAASPVPLNLIGYCWLPEEAEAEIFIRLRAERCHGEWFRATDEVRAMAGLIGAKRVVEIAREIELERILTEHVPSNVSWGSVG